MAKQEKIQSLRGMYDVLPEKQPLFKYVVETFKTLVEQAGYQSIETPLVEDASLFVRGVGTGTDVVDKEIYAFEDRSGKLIALRPEPTAGIARSYIENGMASLPQPVKLTTVGPMFRYDRPQAGRQRQFWQLDVEVFGDASPAADAQVITLANRLFTTLGLETELMINSIGDLESRANYREILVKFLNDNIDSLDDIDKERIKTNPMRVLDSKSPKTADVLKNVPKITDYLNDASKAHFEAVKAYLDAAGIDYAINPLLVRGLDYYSDTVFEFVGKREGQQASLGGGGRYDGLVELLGGPSTPGVGFGLGLERILLELEAASIEAPESSAVQVFVACTKDSSSVGFKLTEDLLNAGIGAVYSEKGNVGSQIGKADKLGVKYALIIGDKELADGNVTVRDMATGEQKSFVTNKIVEYITKSLE
jgi:histidyl-tRNA synthetase